MTHFDKKNVKNHIKFYLKKEMMGVRAGALFFFTEY